MRADQGAALLGHHTEHRAEVEHRVEAARDVGEGAKLLRVPAAALLAQGLAGRVLEHLAEAAQLPGLVVQADHHTVGEEARAVPPEVPTAVLGPTVARSLLHLLLGPTRGAVLRGEDRVGPSSDHLARREAGDAGRPALPLDDPALEVGDDDRVVLDVLDQQREPLVLLAQRGGVADALDVGPGALDDLLDEIDLVGRPLAGPRVVHGHHGDEPAALDQRAAHDRLDPDRAEHLRPLVRPELGVDVRDDQRTTATHVGRDAWSEQIERVDADGAGRARRGPVVADREAVAVGVDIRVGRARDPQVLAQQPGRGRHDVAGVGRRTGRLAERVEEAQPLLAGEQRLLGPLALGDVGAGRRDEQHAAVGAGHRGEREVDVALAAVGDEVVDLGAKQAALRGLQRGLADRLHQRRRPVPPPALPERLADDVLAAKPAGLEAQPVRLDDRAAQGHHDRELRALLEEHAKLRVGLGDRRGLRRDPPDLILRALVIGDVGRGAEHMHARAVAVRHQLARELGPAQLAVLATKPAQEIKPRPRLEGGAHRPLERRGVVRVYEVRHEVRRVDRLVRPRHPEDLVQPVVFPGDVVVGEVPHPDAEPGRLGRQPQPLLARPQLRLGPRALARPGPGVRLCRLAQPPGLHEALDERAELAAQHRRHHRHRHVVDRPEPVRLRDRPAGALVDEKQHRRGP